MLFVVCVVAAIIITIGITSLGAEESGGVFEGWS
jgi:hypothetical protein